jgi:hypothetical protein
MASSCVGVDVLSCVVSDPASALMDMAEAASEVMAHIFCWVDVRCVAADGYPQLLHPWIRGAIRAGTLLHAWRTSSS